MTSCASSISNRFMLEILIDLVGVGKAKAEEVIGFIFFFKEPSSGVEVGLFFMKDSLMDSNVSLISTKLKIKVSAKIKKNQITNKTKKIQILSKEELD